MNELAAIPSVGFEPVGQVFGAAVYLDPDTRPDRKRRRWEPKRLRLRIFAVAGRPIRSERRLARTWPWVGEVTAAITGLQTIASG